MVWAAMAVGLLCCRSRETPKRAKTLATFRRGPIGRIGRIGPIWRTESCLYVSCASRQFFLNLFEGFTFRFRYTQFDENEACGANGSVNPERVSRTETALENREGVSQDKARDPKGGHSNGDSGAANTIGKNFRDQDPGHRSQRHA